MHCKLKTWKEQTKNNIDGQEVPYNMVYNGAAVLYVDSAYKQDNKFYPQVYVEECKYANAESHYCSMLSDSDNNGFFEV